LVEPKIIVRQKLSPPVSLMLDSCDSLGSNHDQYTRSHVSSSSDVDESNCSPLLEELPITSVCSSKPKALTNTGKPIRVYGESSPTSPTFLLGSFSLSSDDKPSDTLHGSEESHRSTDNLACQPISKTGHSSPYSEYLQKKRKSPLADDFEKCGSVNLQLVSRHGSQSNPRMLISRQSQRKSSVAVESEKSGCQNEKFSTDVFREKTFSNSENLQRRGSSIQGSSRRTSRAHLNHMRKVVYVEDNGLDQPEPKNGMAAVQVPTTPVSVRNQALNFQPHPSFHAQVSLANGARSSNSRAGSRVNGDCLPKETTIFPGRPQLKTT